ncbi:MAG: ABC transporter [Methylibium sp.]|nr:ABC transporter [Methylibium sp.]
MLHGYGASLLEGALMTLVLSLASVAVAMSLGLLGALAKLSRSRLLRGLAQTYTTLIRAVPDLVLMLLVFFGGQALINELALKLGHEDYIDINPFVAGVATIGFIFGAYLTETFRGAFLAVPPGQREAAQAFGMGRWLVFARIVAPQMLRHALPALANNWLVLVKSTAIVSVIGLTDLMHRAGLAAGATREPFVFYGAAALMYLLFTSVSEWGFARLQQHLVIGSRKGQL